MTELTGRTYTFEVSIELNDALSFVPGELGTYLAEALFELDRINLLFPGLQVPEPGERIFGVSIQQMGYARRRAHADALAQPTKEAPANEEQRELLSSIEDATLRISDMMRDLRLIKAKAHAMLEQIRTSASWSKPQTQNAKRLLDALQATLESHAAHIEPML